MKPEDLRTLSDLLDQAFDIAPAEREAWLASLQGEALRLAPTLRELLARNASRETADLIDRLPQFTAAIGSDLQTSEFQPGASIGPYRLLRAIGQGGMGEVWLAERADGQLKREVALKLPLLNARRSVLVQRFARERNILGSLNHPHIARLYDAGLTDDGQPYLALEYVQGQAITAYCDAKGMGVRARVQLLQQVLQAVQYAHANLVIHRDLKPSNVLVTADGQAMLLDFGIAKLLQEDELQAAETELTREGGRALTLQHAAPEQITGASISTATDVWALGVLLYELIAGQRPFRHETRGALEQAVLNDEPARPSAGRVGRVGRSLAADLDTIVLKALKKAPGERYATAAAFAEDLDRWLNGEPVRAQPDSAWYRTRKFVTRHRLGVVSGTAALAALASTAGLAMWQALEAREQALRAQQNAEAAQREAGRAQAVQEFVLDIFRANSREQADPQKAQQTTARQLLDVGAARVDQALKDAPESRLEVLGTLAAMYLQIGLRDRALELERARVELSRSTLGPDDPRRAAAALELARHLYDGPQREEARRLIEEARAVLDAAGDTTSRARGELLLRAASFYRYESWRDAQANADAALEFFQRNPVPGLVLVRAHQLAGRVRVAVLDLAQAQALLTAGLELARQREGDAALALIVIAGDLADVQQTIGQFANAERTLRDAIAASERIHGHSNGVTLVLRIGLVDLLLQSGRSVDGLAMRSAVRETIEQAGLKLDAAWRRNAEYLLARNLYEFGRPAQAIPGLRVAVADLARELPRSGAVVQRRRQLAEALTALGQLDEADRLLAESTAGWERFTAGVNQAWMNGHLLLARGRLRLAQGRTGDAITLLQQIVPSRLPVDAVVDLRLLRRDVALSEAWLAAGDPARAIEAASTVLDALRRIAPPYRLPHLEAAAWQALGQAQDRVGKRVAARASLETAVGLRTEHDAPGSLWLAQAQLALAQCLMEQGNPQPARRLQAQAQRSLAEHVAPNPR